MNIPFSFSPNTKAKSGDVNANFTAAKNAIDTLENLTDRNNTNGTPGTGNSVSILRTNLLLQSGIQDNDPGGGAVTVTFPVGYAHNPQVFLQATYGTVKNYALLLFVSTTQFQFYCIRADSTSDVGGTGGAQSIQWLAIGART